MGEYQAISHGAPSSTISRHHPLHSGSRLHRDDHGSALHLPPIAERASASKPELVGKTPGEPTRKVKLRLDAFLGEWLSPDYFERITPPPSSAVMLDQAKADLIRHDDSVQFLQNMTPTSSAKGHFPGGWGSKRSDTLAAAKENSESPLSDLSALKTALTTIQSTSSDEISGATIDTRIAFSAHGYVPPTPTYAISPSHPIPPGYVGHAREACLDIDYLWDSMQPPLDWGTGGDYGEEWSSMHKRFRRGLQSMIQWYRTHDDRSRPISSQSGTNCDTTSRFDQETEEEQLETVLVLVTHGAGCNALIGALTNQPVLLDVGMASLTMAIRTDGSADPSSPSTARRQSSIDIGLSHEYDVKLIASTEHLRAGSNPLSVPQLHNPPRPTSSHRPRFGSQASQSPMYSAIEATDPSIRSSSVPRSPTSSSQTGGLQRSASVAAKPTTGLWSQPVSREPSPRKDSHQFGQDTSSIRNGGVPSMRTSPKQSNGASESKTQTPSTTTTTTATTNKTDPNALPPIQPFPRNPDSQRGLWDKSNGPVKRRWTVNEQSV